MTSLCHPSVMVSLAESSPKYSMLKMIPVLVHNPSSGSFQVTSSPRWSLRRQSFLRSFAMSYVWRRLLLCSDHYKSKLGSEGASMDQSSASSHYRQLPFGNRSAVCVGHFCEALAEVWLTDWAFRMESISIPMWSLSILSAGLASCLWQRS